LKWWDRELDEDKQVMAQHFIYVFKQMRHCDKIRCIKSVFPKYEKAPQKKRSEEHYAMQADASSQCISSNVDLETFIACITTMDCASRLVVLSFVGEICEKMI